MLIYISVCWNTQINLVFTLCLRMLFLECKLYGTLHIYISWEMSSIGRFSGNCAFWKDFKGKKIWHRRNFYMKRTQQICVHRWWLTVPYSQAGLLVQPQCHDNIDVLDWSWVMFDSWGWIDNWSHTFMLTYLKRVGNYMWGKRGKDATKEKNTVAALRFFLFFL